ncbi:MAG: zinc ribbon domain-containing protein [Bacteroidetes bacterium]|nr:zinc ribbon domain-containing protein [Rhodothermia bacterium]MCS7154524.1 zinc ribbon domain-containing protein [Bacteroidota bacterium]MCX7906897.1 zinc ribbon domain-containing protein [Bacteroidota bacterium]MDW8136824.1 FmdB family zinc ribbon protein [Bacteroidota bacterium]MDW8285306.1 FmdB family zinc ribbon protein [Bacteroidota bacterium]
MPTYAYRCQACGHEAEVFQLITEDPLSTCPTCGQEAFRRLISAGSGLIFKGSGFYITDYKRANGNGKSASTEKAEAKTNAD